MKLRDRYALLGAVIAVFLMLPPIFSRQTSFPQDRHNWPVNEITVVQPAAWQGDGAIGLAVADLRQWLADHYGLATELVTDDQIETLPPYAIVLGDRRQRWVEALDKLAALDRRDLGAEGYLIQRARVKGQPVLAVVGADLLGTAYGIFNLVERLRLTPEILFNEIHVSAEPAMTFRLISSPTGPAFPSFEQALRWGYNAVSIEPWPSLVLYDHFDPRIHDPAVYPNERAWIEANREQAREEIRQAKRLHLKVVSSGDVYSFPQQVPALYGSEIGVAGESPVYCPEKPKVQELLAAALDEVLTDFPEIDAIMVRTGENYTLGHLRGNSPLVGNVGCSDLSDTSRLKMVMEEIQTEVADHYGKLYIQRAWTTGDDGFHAQPAVAAAITDGFSAGDRLMISFKHTQTDFWRYNKVNPNIGVGQLPQMVEFQCAREFEGKGAFPDFLGEEFARGGQEVSPSGGVAYAYQRGVRAIWVWAEGGGWDGPVLRNDLWVEANIYAVSKLAWDPSLSPQALALDWANLRFGRDAAPLIARALLRSDDAVLAALYVRPFALQQGGWTPNNLWVRDDIIQSGGYVLPLYRASQGAKDFQDTLAEKQAALQLVDLMIEDLSRALPLTANRQDAEDALNTLRYEKSLFQVLESYLRGLFYYYRWSDGGRHDNSAQQEAMISFQRWREAWRAHREEIALLPGVATPFRDQGMEQTVLDAMRDLTQRPGD